MSKRSLDYMINRMRHDKSLSDAFTKAVSDFALARYHDVTPEDVKEFIDNQPRSRPLPNDGQVSVTCAIGEEDRNGRTQGDGTLEGVQNGGGMATTMAMGEEGSRFPRLRPPEDIKKDAPPMATSMALGEEDKKPTPPHKKSPYGDATTMMVGEEDKKPTPPTRSTMAVGEEDKKPTPPKKDAPKKDKPSGLTTLAIGEEGRKPKAPGR